MGKTKPARSAMLEPKPATHLVSVRMPAEDHVALLGGAETAGIAAARLATGSSASASISSPRATRTSTAPSRPAETRRHQQECQVWRTRHRSRSRLRIPSGMCSSVVLVSYVAQCRH
jgi:ribulose kinase